MKFVKQSLSEVIEVDKLVTFSCFNSCLSVCLVPDRDPVPKHKGQTGQWRRYTGGVFGSNL